jgi:hypothetical protein
LLFLKMDHENSRMLGKPSVIPVEFKWVGLLLDGDELERHYRDILAAAIIDDLKAALEQFEGMAGELGVEE